GQDAAGIVTESNGRLNLMKNNGSVSDVFTQENIVSLKGNIGIGHVRYPTSGGRRSCEAQPLYTNFPYGIAIAHNGNLTNTKELAQRMQRSYRHVNTDSDSEILLNVFADELQRRQLANITPDDIFDSVNILMRKCKGAFAVVMLINRLGLLAFRDPHGIRPLCFGSRETPTGSEDSFFFNLSTFFQHSLCFCYRYRLCGGLGERGDRRPGPLQRVHPGARRACRRGHLCVTQRSDLHPRAVCSQYYVHAMHL
ncbi:MAG: hypothetical protein B7Z05_09110, partial [Thiotrichales bacterium 32-46-8]